MRRLTVTTTIMVVGVSAALTACGGGGASNATSATTGTVGGSAQVKGTNAGNDSLSVGNNASLPSGFPKVDVPLPTNATLSGVDGYMTNGAQTWTVILKTSKDASQAVSDYRQQLQSAGYTINDGTAIGGLLSAFTAVGSKYDVKVIGSGTANSKTNPAGLVLTVASHNPSNDTTTTTPAP